MTKDEVFSAINEIMVTGFEVDPDILKPQAHLMDDLGLDSLDGVDLVVAIEKKFGCRLEESEVRSMATLGDIYDYCAKQVEK
jgi:acyl carrier protein